MEQRSRDPRQNATLLFSFALVFSAAAEHVQDIFTNSSASHPTTVSWLNNDSDSLNVNPKGKATLTLRLYNIDALLSKSQDPQHFFNRYLKRDTLRVQALIKLASIAAQGPASPYNRIHTFVSFNSSVISGYTQGTGAYFMRLGIGTPPQYFNMILDTGSDVTWVQCAPCRKCYKQHDPIFKPKKSQSFASVPCNSPLCQELSSPRCNTRKKCRYNFMYGDKSFTLGELSIETLTFQGTRVSPIAFGCSHHNEGFVSAAGILGLGQGNLSFPRQANSLFNMKFSYCLVPLNASKSSWIVFGDLTVPPTTKFTPLLTNLKQRTFYYVHLRRISVGGTHVRGITSKLFKLNSNGTGGVILDSGTSVTRLIRPAYVALRDAFLAETSKLKRTSKFSLFDTCYDTSGLTSVKFPTVVFHFQGAKMSLPASNYMVPMDNDGTFCFAFASIWSGPSIIGNIQQQGFQMVFDLQASKVGFAPKGCP